MSTFEEDLRKMLRDLRLACGYSQKAVACALGIERSTYSCYESGKVVPGLGTLKKLADIFHIPAEAFLYPEEYICMEKTRQRAPKKLSDDPETIGQLSPEEKRWIAKRRTQR